MLDLISESARVTLQNVSVQVREAGYVGDMVAPIIENAPRKGRIYRDITDDWHRNDAKPRAPGTSYMGGSNQLDYVDYVTKQFAWRTPVTREDLEARGLNPVELPPIDMGMDAVEYSTRKIVLAKEVNIANLVLDGTWSDGNAGGEDVEGLWAATDTTNTFIADIQKARKKIASKTGLIPNTLEMDYGTFCGLQLNTAVTQYLSDNNLQMLTTGVLSQMLMVDEVIISSAILSTDERKVGGAGMTNTKYLWEKNATKGSAFLYYKPKSAGLRTPSAIYQARVAQVGSPRKIESWFDEDRKVYNYDVMEETAIIQVTANLGYLFKDTILT